MDKPGVHIAYSNPYGNDSWLTDADSFAGVIHAFAGPPLSGRNEQRTIPRDGAPDVSVKQCTTVTDTNIVITLTRTNAMDGLDHKVTFVWEKGRKWWSHAVEQLGTNRVTWADLIDE